MKTNLTTTEQRNEHTKDLDTMSALQIVTVMNEEDCTIPEAVAEALPQIAETAEMAAETIRSGGRIFYIGAGTSGRLGVLDASECSPTFGVQEGLVTGVIAGGPEALMHAAEGAEDDPDLAVRDLEAHHLSAGDLVIGIAASGRTPYVAGALKHARQTGCRTASVSCCKDAKISALADCAIEAVTGPEVLTGSTRLKAGTATKMILNMISTAAMVRLGKACENLMIDVVPSNRKLQDRAKRIITELTGVGGEEAEAMLAKAGGSCKTAVVMILADCPRNEAEQLLRQADGHVREALRLRQEGSHHDS